jgi:hypothetical protein
MKALHKGDIVVVTKLDWLGRSTRELIDLIDRIGKAGASFWSLGGNRSLQVGATHPPHQHTSCRPYPKLLNLVHKEAR